MAKIDDVLRLLENGKWHDLREMEENTQLHDCDISSILRFLVQYDFIKLDKEGKKAKLASSTRDFLNKIRHLEGEERL